MREEHSQTRPPPRPPRRRSFFCPKTSQISFAAAAAAFPYMPTWNVGMQTSRLLGMNLTSGKKCGII